MIIIDTVDNGFGQRHGGFAAHGILGLGDELLRDGQLAI